MAAEPHPRPILPAGRMGIVRINPQTNTRAGGVTTLGAFWGIYKAGDGISAVQDTDLGGSFEEGIQNLVMINPDQPARRDAFSG